MEEVSIIGLDLAKRSFQAHGALADGSVAFRKKLRREKVLGFLAEQPRCVVAMEACGSAHHWGRAIRDAGHEVRLIPPAYVKPFVKRQKNDAADAEAIAEAASRPTMRFVAVKTEETTGARHAVSDTGSPGPSTHPADQCAARHHPNMASWAARTIKRGDFRSGDRRYDAFTSAARGRIGAPISRSDRRAFEEGRGVREGDSVRSQRRRMTRRLQTMPGVGPITAMAIETFAPPMEVFRRGRDFAAWLGELVPAQHSTGGKTGSRENLQRAARYSPAVNHRRNGHCALGLPEGGAGRNLAASDARTQTAHACGDRPRQQIGPFHLGHADKGEVSSSCGCDHLIHDQVERPRERRACEEVEERKGK